MFRDGMARGVGGDRKGKEVGDSNRVYVQVRGET